MSSLGNSALMPPIIAVPNVSLTLISTAVLGVEPEALKISLCSAKRAGDQHRRRREVADDELVALLGDLRRRGDVHDQGHAVLLGDLGDGDGLARVEGADQDVGAGVDRLLGLGAGDVGLGLGVVVHHLEAHRHLHVGENVVGHVGAAPAGLADLRLQARGRQQQRDLEVGRRRLARSAAATARRAGWRRQVRSCRDRGG